MLEHEKELIAYTLAFVSFIFPKIKSIKEIILFGSAARGEATKESDIDLFFDLENTKNEEKIKKEIEREIDKFYKSNTAETWFLRGIKNQIKINVGKLEEWKLKRSIISDGISLYSKYKETPKNLNSFGFFIIAPIKNIAKRNKIMRKLFGRREKNIYTKGIVEETGGKKLSPTSFVVNLKYVSQIINLLNKEKVNYRFFEFWTDQF